MVSAVLSAMSALPASMLHSDAHSNQPHSPHSPLPSPDSSSGSGSTAKQHSLNDTTPHSSAASSPTSAVSSSLSSSPASSHLSTTPTPTDDSTAAAVHSNGHHTDQMSPAATHTSLPPISEDESSAHMDISHDADAEAEPVSPTTVSTLSVPSSPQPTVASQPFSPTSGGDSSYKRKLTVEIPAQSAAASSAVTPLPPLHPGNATAAARFDVWMTPAQARAESKKLKGYRWVPVQPPQIASAGLTGVGVAALREEKRVRKERKYDDELSTITTPTVKRERTGGQTPGGGRRQSGSSGAPSGSPNAQPPSSPYSNFAPPTPRAAPPRNFKRQQSAPIQSSASTGVSVRALELRLEALQQHQAMLLAQQNTSAASPSTTAAAGKKRKSTPASFPSHDVKKAKTPDFAVPASPSASPNFSATFPASGSPTIHSSSPQLTRTGRSVRTPTHFSAVDPVTLSSDLRRAKHVVELLMAYKPAFGVFNVPVNYDDPTKPYYATGYLEAIKGKVDETSTHAYTQTDQIAEASMTLLHTAVLTSICTLFVCFVSRPANGFGYHQIDIE